MLTHLSLLLELQTVRLYPAFQLFPQPKHLNLYPIINLPNAFLLLLYFIAQHLHLHLQFKVFAL